VFGQGFGFALEEAGGASWQSVTIAAEFFKEPPRVDRAHAVAGVDGTRNRRCRIAVAST